MEIGARIRACRAEAGMSQDDLAARVYVSRQTISSWENGKTYPDVQSLLLLSEIFDATVDSLIKGDVDTMTETIDRDVRIMKRLGYVMLGFTLLMVTALIWLSVQLIVWNWTFEQTVPTALLALVLWGIVMFAAAWADRIKRDNDLITYREILSFWHGEPVDRDTERGRRERLIPRWMKIVRAVGWMLIAAAAGAFVRYWGSSIVTALLG